MGSTRHVVALLGTLLFASAASAQTTEATVSGTVTDPSGANVLGAAVTAINVATGVSTARITNQAGVYVFASLPPGKYRITAEHPGFRRAAVNDVDLAVGTQITVNMSLDLGQTSETVEVKATATAVNVSSATVGNVVEARRILDLPLVGRSAYDLVGTQAGVVINGTNGVNINGSQTGAVNYSTDGINTQDNLLNGAFNALVANTVSVDRVEEFRVVTSPADAEYGRGSGQIQLITRGGNNQFRGSAWEELRNTDLNANDWFNNQAGTNPITHRQQAPRNVLVRNQFGLRFGGPVRRNKTFFNGIWEGDHQNQRVAVNQTVYTPTAMQGLFRFFPGAVNANAAAGIPTVDTSGNPIQPANATGPLQTVSVFGRDPNRPAADSTGIVGKYLGLAPPPNNYLVGDGLNTAGFLWARPVVNKFQLFEGRIDHIFSEKHRISLTMNHQAYYSLNVASAQPLPQSPPGLAPTETTQFSLALTSTLRPNLLNEVRIGVFRPRTIIWTEYDPDAGPTGAAGQKLLPTATAVPYYLGVTGNITNPLAAQGTTGSSNRMTQNWQLGDDLTWIRGRHTLKAGVIARFIANDGYDLGGVLPASTAGAGAVAVQGINTIPGIGSNSGGAQNLLIDLTGSISSVTQTYNSPGGKNPTFLAGESRYSDLITPEYSGYFKDDFKLTPSFTLNLGIRYEWYGVPYDGLGRALAPVGGTAGIFGISGTNLGALFQPGALGGSLTTFQLVGPGTANPGTKVYNNDNNNFAPFVGFAWSLPEGPFHWLTGGKDKTVIRAGYGISYQRDSLYLAHMNTEFAPNGLTTSPVLQSTGLLNVGNIALPIPTTATPLSLTPLDGTRNQVLYAYNSGLRNPYIQNFSFSIQRAFSENLSLQVSYVGSAGNKLVRSYDIDEINILNNGFLAAYQTVQSGGDSPLINSILAPIGLNSTTVRSNSIFQGYFAGNNPAGMAALLQSSLLSPPVGGKLLAQAGLPENYFSANPQFSGSVMTDNTGHSTYHSLQIELNKRLADGLTIQGSYVFSKALGSDSAGDQAIFFSDYRTLRNENLDKGLLAFNHRSVIKLNGFYELPLGPGKLVGRGSHGVVGRVIGGWQTGAILSWFTGAPISFTGANGLNTSLATSTATEVGPMPGGAVQKVGNGVMYFAGLTQITDPSVANITTLGNLRALSGLKAIANASGTPVLVNALPGQIGGLALGTGIAPSIWRLDLNLLKRIRINERFTMQLGATAENLSNSPQFSGPNTSIASPSFGRITGTASTYRIVVLQSRLNF